MTKENDDEHCIIGTKIEYMKLPPIKNGKCIKCDCIVGCTEGTYLTVPQEHREKLKFMCFECFEKEGGPQKDDVINIGINQKNELIEYLKKFNDNSM